MQVIRTLQIEGTAAYQTEAFRDEVDADPDNLAHLHITGALSSEVTGSLRLGINAESKTATATVQRGNESNEVKYDDVEVSVSGALTL